MQMEGKIHGWFSWLNSVSLAGGYEKMQVDMGGAQIQPLANPVNCCSDRRVCACTSTISRGYAAGIADLHSDAEPLRRPKPITFESGRAQCCF